MIINRALFREAATYTAAIIVLLLVLMLITGITQALGQAATGKRTLEVVFQLFSLEIIRVLDTLLPLSLYIGILMTIGRWKHDNELTVLSACGTSLLQLLKPVLLLSLLVAVAVAVSSLYLSPLAAKKVEQIKNTNSQDIVVENIKGGQFNGTKIDSKIFYVEKIDKKNNIFKNVFVSQPPEVGVDEDTQGVIVAESGRQRLDSSTGITQLILENGSYYQGEPGKANFKIISFEKYHLYIQPAKLSQIRSSIEATPTKDIINSSDVNHIAELQWRLARPVAVFILMIFAVVLSYSGTQKSRFRSILIATLIFFIYSNVLGIGVALLQQEKIPYWLGLWWVHALFFIAALILLFRSNRQQPLFSFFGLARS